MSMRPRVLAEVPEKTVAVARAAFPKPTLAMRVRDELGEVFADGAFLDAFGVRGRPGISPGQLAMVTVMQFAENLTDRQAADAVRGRIDWKYCLGLELTDPGFDFRVLSQFRTRLVTHDLPGYGLRDPPGPAGRVGAGHRAGPTTHRRDPCAGRSPRSQPSGDG